MFFFGDAIALLRESYTLVYRNSYAFLQLSDRAYVSAGFEFNSLRARLLTALHVVYAIVRLEMYRVF